MRSRSPAGTATNRVAILSFALCPLPLPTMPTGTRPGRRRQHPACGPVRGSVRGNSVRSGDPVPETADFSFSNGEVTADDSPAGTASARYHAGRRQRNYGRFVTDLPPGIGVAPEKCRSSTLRSACQDKPSPILFPARPTLGSGPNQPKS